MVQSIGVIAAAIIIFVKPEYSIADPICTYLFSVLVMMTTVPIFKDCVSMIMEVSPDEIDVLELYNELLKIKTV
jgi:zinc transporter 2